MAVKSVSDMTFGELEAERGAAELERFNADYIEGLNAWQTAREAADQRVKAVEDEIERRISRFGAANGE